MWIRTVSGWYLFEVAYTQQGIPYPTKPISPKEQDKNYKMANLERIWMKNQKTSWSIEFNWN